MQIVIENIKMPIRHKEEEVISAARKIVRLSCISASNFSIYKKSIDARRKSDIHYVYAVSAEVADGTKVSGNIKEMQWGEELEIPLVSMKDRPVVVGMGPCGLFAAYILAKSGNPPLIIERGEDVETRKASVEKFWQTGVLNPDSNIQFGEGGAGTFSDGKLNTRISDPRQRFVLKTFVDFGATEDILYKAKPHVGTDVLCEVIKNMRKELIGMGVEVRYKTCVTDIKIKDGKVCEIELDNGESIKCRKIILAIGHSSRDTYEMVHRREIVMEQKPFAVGVRIEHAQSFINEMQYGNAEGLPPAEYRLVYNGKDRSCYSFCMCPGGVVVNASSEVGMLAVNGMSEYLRDGKNANSALVVNVKPTDFNNGVLGGIEFQRKYEKLAFMLGGGDGKAPVQLARDFLDDRPTVQLGDVLPTVTSGYKTAELKTCLPEFVAKGLCDGLIDFEHKIKGFARGDAVLTGIESRTSAPVRIKRGENMQSINAEGLYPAGEGAGYAGGIVSAAVDGIRVAFAMVEENV